MPKPSALSDNTALTNAFSGPEVQLAQPPPCADSSALLDSTLWCRSRATQRRNSGDCGLRTLAGRGKNRLHKLRRDENPEFVDRRFILEGLRQRVIHELAQCLSRNKKSRMLK